MGSSTKELIVDRRVAEGIRVVTTNLFLSHIYDFYFFLFPPSWLPLPSPLLNPLFFYVC